MRRIVTRLYLFIWLLLLRTCLLSANAQTNSLIQDPNLETAVRLTLQKPTGPLTEADLLSLTDLAAPNYQITSLGGLELARHLQVLQLAANPITNIGPLTGLSALRQLDLSFNPVGDPTPLLGLTNLEFLLLPFTELKQLGFLAQLPFLTELDIRFNHIADCTPLAGLTHLINLSLGDNAFGDLSPLAALSQLQNLSAADLDITNIAFLSSLTNLQHLDLSQNRISQFAPLLKLMSIKDLDLSGNPITNLATLSVLSNLSRLVVAQIGLTNLQSLVGITQLMDLELEYNQLTDISALAGMTNLIRLDLGFNAITNFSALANLTNLTDLEIQANGIANLSFLHSFTWLQGLGITYNRVRDLAPVSGLTNLQRLDASYNLFTDISPLETLTNLTQVVLVENLLDLTTGAAALQIIQTLQSRGVAVYYQPQSEPPAILVRSNWLIAANQKSSITFRLGFVASPGSAPTCGASSSDPALIPHTNLVPFASFGGQSWNISVTPLKDQTGTADLTLYATNEAGLWTNAIIHVAVVNPTPFDGRQLDSPELVWSTAGDPPWFNETASSHDGVGAAESGATNSWVQAKVTGPGTLSYWWRLTSDALFEHGQFTATSQDRNLQGTHDLYETDQWQQTVIGLPAGEWVLKWSPEWDWWYNYGTSNALWLDQVSFVPGLFAPRLELAPPWDHSPDGSFWVDLTGEESQSYDIEASNDLYSWFPLTRVTCVNFQAQFSDRNSAAAGRFYRATRVP